MPFHNQANLSQSTPRGDLNIRLNSVAAVHDTAVAGSAGKRRLVDQSTGADVPKIIIEMAV
jgi:hypothetical protein